MKADITLDGSIVYIRTEKGVIRTYPNFFPEKINLEIPEKFLKLLLNGVEWAWEFLYTVSESKILDEFKRDLLQEAAENGFEEAASKLKRYNENVPDGKPKIYSAPEKHSSRSIEITDGKFCVCLSLPEKRQFNFPPNVYIYPKKYFSISEEDLGKVQEHLNELFEFIKNLAEVPNYYVTPGRQEKCLRTFFDDREKANKMLEEIKKDCRRRAERDEVCHTIELKNVLEVPGGYVVQAAFFPPDTFHFVREDSRVFRILGNNPTARRENVLKLYKGKIEEKWLADETDQKTLEEVSRKIGNVRPDLAVVI
jgi:Asp-tRNA(Asn)/Glu-tRNA(Gln) amidotransferase C subunit